MDNLSPQAKIETEKIKAPESGVGFEVPEKSMETQEKDVTSQPEKVSQDAKSKSTQATVGAPGIDRSDSALHQTVEAILEEDLEDLYFQMNEVDQEKFKKKGEETATEIIKLINETKTTFKKVFGLIKKWLQIIPGVNKFFVEQEAKIKADRILEIEE